MKGKKFTKEHKKKLSKAHIGMVNKKRIKIKQYTLDGKFLNIWEGINEAQEKLNIGNISACCRKKRKYAGGFMWKYTI